MNTDQYALLLAMRLMLGMLLNDRAKAADDPEAFLRELTEFASVVGAGVKVKWMDAEAAAELGLQIEREMLSMIGDARSVLLQR